MLSTVARSLSLLVALTLLTFLIADWAPGDYLTTLRLSPQVSEETVEANRKRLGLDRPWLLRYFDWCGSAITGGFGTSLAYGVPVSQLLADRLPNTLALNLASTLGAWILAFAGGSWAAAHAGSWPDRVLNALQAWLSGTPDLLLALAGIWLWGSKPWLPFAVLTIGTLPSLLIHTRSAIASALGHDSVKAARMHHIRSFRLWTSYVLPLAAAPLVALAGLSFGTLLSASLLVEATFSYPGIGSLMLDAIQARDTAVAAAVTAIAGLALLSANLLADVVLRWLDPRKQPA